MSNDLQSSVPLTDSARRVLRHVRERACDRGMVAGELTEATADMLAVLSMIRWERKVGRVALEHLGVELNDLAEELDTAIVSVGQHARSPTGPSVETDETGQARLAVDLTTPLQPLVDRAAHEATTLGHNYIGTEHLLLAAIRSTDATLQAIWTRHGVTYERAGQAIRALLI